MSSLVSSRLCLTSSNFVNFAAESYDNSVAEPDASAVTTGVLTVSSDNTRAPHSETNEPLSNKESLSNTEPRFITSPTPLGPGPVSADTHLTSVSVSPVLTCTLNSTPRTLSAPPTIHKPSPSTLVQLEELEELDADSGAYHQRWTAATKAIDLTRANLKVEKAVRAEARQVERKEGIRASYDREFAEFEPASKSVKTSQKVVRPSPSTVKPSSIKSSGKPQPASSTSTTGSYDYLFGT